MEKDRDRDRERSPRNAKRPRKKVCSFCVDRVEVIKKKKKNHNDKK